MGVDRRKLVAALAVQLLIFTLMLLIWRSCSTPRPQFVDRIVDRVMVSRKVDTMVELKTRDRIVIQAARPQVRIRTVHDTLIQIRPFIASLDTVLIRDTVHAAFDLRDSSMSIVIKPHPDSTMIIRDTTLVTIRLPPELRPWYETAGLIGGGAVIGTVIGLLIANGR